MYLKVFVVFLAMVFIVGLNVVIIDHLSSLPHSDIVNVLLWVNINIVLLTVLSIYVLKKIYNEFFEKKVSDLRKKIFLVLALILGVPFIFLTTVAIAGKSSYLRVFTDESLKEVLELSLHLEQQFKELNIPPTEKTKVLNAIKELETKTESVRNLVRHQKVVLINFITTFLVISLLTLLGVLIVASHIARRFSQPLEELDRALSEVAKGNLNVQLNREVFKSTNIRELKNLLENFERTLERLRQLYQKLEREKFVSEQVFKNVSTGVALFHTATGELLEANPSYRKNFNFSDLKELENFVQKRENLRFEKTHLGTYTLVFIEDLTPFIVNRRYHAWKEIAQRLAHDIKNPLNAIGLSLDTIEMLAEKNMELLKEKFPHLSRNIRQQIKNITDLLDSFNNLTSQEEELKKEIFSLKELLYELKNSYQRNNFQIFVEIPYVYIKADRKQLRRVFENFIKNSYEAIERKREKLRAEGKPDDFIGILRFRMEEGSNELHIIDNGPGIDPEKGEEIFLPFVSTKGKGRGLGLFSAKKIIEEHGWKIRVLPKKEKQEGAHFVIEIDRRDIYKRRPRRRFTY
jgi:two-component system nitrogen regulation sensor histidine kinase NtrY